MIYISCKTMTKLVPAKGDIRLQVLERYGD